jgi:hypothetical protein
VERELGMLFSKGASSKGTGFGTKARNSGIGFNMLVEDIRDGVLVSSLNLIFTRNLPGY